MLHFFIETYFETELKFDSGFINYDVDIWCNFRSVGSLLFYNLEHTNFFFTEIECFQTLKCIQFKTQFLNTSLKLYLMQDSALRLIHIAKEEILILNLQAFTIYWSSKNVFLKTIHLRMNWELCFFGSWWSKDDFI